MELSSKGPSSKGNPHISKIILGPNDYFPIHFYIGNKGILVYGKKMNRFHEIPLKQSSTVFTSVFVVQGDYPQLCNFIHWPKKDHLVFECPLFSQKFFQYLPTL